MSRRSHFLQAQSAAIPATVEKQRDETIESHPAYGQIMVFKTSGMAALYGSDFPHQNYVSIEIHESELHRSLSRDWAFPKRELIRIEMSEAQFVSMMASQGNGSGTQCTIVRKVVGGTYEAMPRLELRDSAPIYADEGRERINDALKQLDDLVASLEGDTSGLSKAKRDAIVNKVRDARRQLGPNLQFVADSFGEHLEDRAEKAKVEIMAWMSNTIARAGLDALGVAPLELATDPGRNEE